jgi:uncharacterized membrane protein YgdD (TMEM256/DUF423 family)
MTRRAARITAAVAGLSGVALGAFGAHALRGELSLHETAELWKTAVLYHLVHAVALLWASTAEPLPKGALWCWASGIVLFCGSLYLLALCRFPLLGAVTPLGGLLLLGGWLAVLLGALRR